LTIPYSYSEIVLQYTALSIYRETEEDAMEDERKKEVFFCLNKFPNSTGEGDRIIQL
jgi:hypothetical protein